MTQLDTVFRRLQDQKKEQRDLRKILRDALFSSKEYEAHIEKLDEMKRRKKELEEGIHESNRSEVNKLEQLKASIDADREMLADLAMSHYAKGETVTVMDAHDQVYEPQFSVAFKKVQ